MSSTKTPKKLAVRRLQSSRPFTALLDQVFFIFAGLASFWLAWLVLREGWATGGWWLVGLFFVVWAIVSYIALPRLHRILSNVYVPNYFIGRTRTADGILSDPVNLSVRGPEEKLHKAMTTAGWALAGRYYAAVGLADDTDNIKSTELSKRASFYRLFCLVGDRILPISKKLMAIQCVGTMWFWRCPGGWLLPGGHRVDLAGGWLV